MAEFASNGKGNLGVTLGAIGTGLGLLDNGFGLFNNMNRGQMNCQPGCSENTGVTRYELEQAETIGRLQSEKDALISDQKTDSKILELYKYMEQQFTKDRENVSSRFTATGQEIASLAANQAVINQRVTDNLNFVDAKIDRVYTDMDSRFSAVYKEIECKTLPLDKKIPLDSICPSVMPRYNSWVAPTTTTTTTPTTPTT